MEPPGPYRRVWTCALFFCDEIGKTENRPLSYMYMVGQGTVLCPNVLGFRERIGVFVIFPQKLPQAETCGSISYSN